MLLGLEPHRHDHGKKTVIFFRTEDPGRKMILEDHPHSQIILNMEYVEQLAGIVANAHFRSLIIEIEFLACISQLGI